MGVIVVRGISPSSEGALNCLPLMRWRSAPEGEKTHKQKFAVSSKRKKPKISHLILRDNTD